MYSGGKKKRFWALFLTNRAYLSKLPKISVTQVLQSGNNNSTFCVSLRDS